MALVPEIKLIRTDTTLDLSQKAEKVRLNKSAPGFELPGDSDAACDCGIIEISGLNLLLYA